MADQKLTALTATTAIDGTELLYVVEDPSGSPLSRKVLASDVKTYMAAGAGTPGGSDTQFQYNNATAFGGANLWRESADIIAQRNSTTAQSFQVYNTYTSSSVFERANISWSGNILTIGTSTTGGTARDINIAAAGSNITFATAGFACWRVDGIGSFVSPTDNALDIGAAATTRPRTIYAGTSILVTGTAGGVGYGTGAGGAVTQITSRTTGVTLDRTTGAITLFSAAGSTTAASFTVTNSKVAATDVIILSQKSGTDKYMLGVSAVAAGSFEITFRTHTGTTTEQPVFNFAVIKGVAA